MWIVILQLPVGKRKIEAHLESCPSCHGEAFQRGGKATKPLGDNRFRTVLVYRYRCCHCHRTLRQAQGRLFRHCPQGIDRADQTQHMHKLAAIYWVLEMRLRGVVVALVPFGVQLSHLTVWRDLQEQADLLEKHCHLKPVNVLGVDGDYPLWKGKKPPLLIAVDLGNERPVAIAQVDESNPQAVRRFLEPLVKQPGISLIVT